MKQFFFILIISIIINGLQSCSSPTPNISKKGNAYFNKIADREGCLTYSYLSGGVSSVNEEKKNAIVLYLEACNGVLMPPDVDRLLIDSLAQISYEECLNKEVFDLVIVQVRKHQNTGGLDFEYEILKDEKKVSINQVNRW